MSEFELALVAINDYVDQPSLPSAQTAERIRRALTPCGARPVRQAQRTDAADLISFLDQWSLDKDGPGPTLLYWVGHGSREGQLAWLLSSNSQSPLTQARAVNARSVAEMLQTRWTERTAGEGAWTVLVLDCCRGRDAATAIINHLTADAGSRPAQLAIVEVGGNSATEVGRFADALEQALARFIENDAQIPLRTLLLAITDHLQLDSPTMWLSRDAVIRNPRAQAAALVANQETLARWRDLLRSLDAETRNHFLAKAQGTELGQLDWQFQGRRADSERLATWLRETDAGMLVVTGEPGAGKSAFLGRFVALADPRVASVLDGSGMTKQDTAARPESNAFDSIVHLTGKTVQDVVAAIRDDVPHLDWRGGGFVGTDGDARITVLVDALDEAQAPHSIAYDVLRPLAQQRGVRVIVGTRRSLEEGPDLPVALVPELLDALGVSEDDALVLRREPDAMANYARSRLSEAATQLDPVLVAEFAAGVARADQPFLFVRLATHELLARRGELDRQVIARILEGSHGGVFGMAVERLGKTAAATVQLLKALAYAHGRGLPRHDGVWCTVARALGFDQPLGEADIERALAVAAPYIVLDGEHGQSVYRVAHKTFAEWFVNRDPSPSQSHAAIAGALFESASNGPWSHANPYVLFHLIRHAATSAPHLRALCCDPGWLAATLDRFGIDALLSILEAPQGSTRVPTLVKILGAIRRARVALATDPGQLAAQLHARLRDEDNEDISGLVKRLSAIAPTPWLRISYGGGTWGSSSSAVQTFGAKVRALACGRLRGQAVVLVGTGSSVVSWAPAKGTTEVLVKHRERITALALGTIHGRDLVAIVSGYEVTVYPTDGGAPVLREFRNQCKAVALGILGGTPVLALSSGGNDVQLRRLDGDGSWLISVASPVLAMTFKDDSLLMLSSDGRGLRVASSAGGPDRVLPIDSAGVAYDLVDTDDGLIAVVGARESISAWHVDSGNALGRAEPDAGFTVRTASALVTKNELLFAAGNDTDHEGGYVKLLAPGTRRKDQRDFSAIVAISLRDSVAVELTSTGIHSLDPFDGGNVDLPSEQVAALLRPAAPSYSVFRGQWQLGPSGGRHEAKELRLEEPGQWPISARAFGEFEGKPVVATAHHDGVCWLWSAETRWVIAGPFGGSGRRVIIKSRRTKGGPQPSVAVAFRNTPTGTFLARIHEGEVNAWRLGDSRQLSFNERLGSEATAVALGQLNGQPVLARGAAGGAISLWTLNGQRLCGLTLDSGIGRLWFDERTGSLIIYTNDGTLHVAEIVPGAMGP